jgi:hypothetical protein
MNVIQQQGIIHSVLAAIRVISWMDINREIGLIAGVVIQLVGGVINYYYIKNIMIYKKYIFIIILFSSVLHYSQSDKVGNKKGKVGYVSSQFVYVNFQNTDGINEGDTLFIKSKNKIVPALIVRHLSTSSAACERMLDQNFKQDLVIYAKSIDQQIITTQTEKPQILIPVTNSQPIEESRVTSVTKNKKSSTEISGRYSIQSYTDLNNLDQAYEYQRWRHSLRFSAQNIGNSGLSLSTYTIFSYRVDQWSSVSSNLGKAIKIYDLNLNYRFAKSTQLWLGRYLNTKISNISVIDGLQFENGFSFLTLGLVVGSRPDFTNFGLNTKLFEYGVYLNRIDTIGTAFMENTISIFEQTNDFKTDRRFVYFQHTNNILSHTYLFASAEVDLYKRINNIPESDFSLTSLYVSGRYAPIRQLSFSLSYDERKNVIYYETFKSLSDSILENEMRKGLRARAVVRPFNNVSLGLQYGYRFKQSDAKPVDNYGGNLSFTMIPFIEASTTFNFNRIHSSYVDGYVYSVNLYKSFMSISSDFSIGFRKTDYTFVNSTYKLNEKAVLVDFSTSVLRPFSFSISYEGVFESARTYGRILIDLTTRF